MTKDYILENLITKTGGLNSNKTKFIEETSEELYLIFNDTTPYKCYCGNNTAFLTFKKGYREYCSTKCLNNSKKVKDNKKNTLMTNYGVDSPLKSKELKEKALKTSFSRYGNGNNYDKIINTKKELYGDENYNNREKAKSTCLALYGEENYSLTKEFSDLLRKIPLELLDDFSYYSYIVWKTTKRQEIKLLKNFDKRGRIDLNKEAYHLDHQYSIREGFLNNIPTYIIGNIENLEMILGRDNCSKQANCSITIEELSRNII